MKGPSQSARVHFHAALAAARWLPLTAAILVVASCTTTVTNPSAHSPATQVDATGSSSKAASTDRLTSRVLPTVSKSDSSTSSEPPPSASLQSIPGRTFTRYSGDIPASSTCASYVNAINVPGKITNLTFASCSGVVGGTVEPTIVVTRADKILIHGPSVVRVDPANFADVNALVVTPKLVGRFEIVALNVPCETASIQPHGCAAINVIVTG